MEPTDEPQHPATGFEAVLAIVDARQPPERASLVGAFAGAYLRRMVRGGEEGPDPESLYAEAVELLEFASARGNAPSAVRAFTPSLSEHGYGPGVSVLETNADDLPFMVDSVTAELRARGLSARRVVHPIVGTERDRGGRIVRVLHAREALARESVMHFELDRRLAPDELAALEDSVRGVLRDVAIAVHSFDALRDRVTGMEEIARAAATRYGEDEIADTVAFLRWLSDEHFLLLGYREYDLRDGALRVVENSGVGLLADASTSSYAQPVPLDRLSEQMRARALEGELLIVAKTNRPSPVRKRERMDYIGVRRVAADGTIVGEARLLGLFSTRADAERASGMPLLARKLRHVLDAEDLIPGSHDYKAAVQLFDGFPKDELFAAPLPELRRTIVALLSLQGDDVGLLGRRSQDGRNASLIAALPRARHNATVRDGLRALLARRFPGATLRAHEVLGAEDRVQYHLALHSPQGELPDLPLAELERDLAALVRTWEDGVSEALIGTHGEERGQMLAARWLQRFPHAYRAATRPDHAADDVGELDRLAAASERFGVRLQNDGGRTRAVLLKHGPKVELSQATRLLEDLGLRVIEELPTRLDGDELWLQAFGVLGEGDRALDLVQCGDRVCECLVACFTDAAESDSLNRLVVSGGLRAAQVEVLRAYRRYRQRIGSRYTEGYQNDVIAQNPELTAKIVRYFELRFDPAHERDEAAEDALRAEIRADLDDVPLLDHDRILRNQLGIIEATVRTNVYRPDRGPMAFKLRSADVPAIPHPAPLYEIYVCSPDVEGIHLRGGMIARGGLRWSDRMDYRTEVFGLMRAQMTKNAVIVPAGAKGGFYLRRPPTDPAALKAEVERRYVAYIGALLDVTDDLVDGEVVHPAAVRCHDGDDAYLVVAADKGTATFSDTANAVAQQRGFWLGDAFASGGSAGYDHKALGITARGAWESVKRHFRGLGVDPVKDEFTVIGIGDMSGDVFGNGMLLSDRIRLVAAYDHRHVFLDPDPDAAASFAERRRLFELPGSSWDDYDRALISAGGGVFARSLKRIAIPQEVRAALAIDDGDDHMAPADLIRAILRAPVDLFWNGGIGTVVKASTESDADARDRSSDSIRVDAADLRCRVVGEGGNLGFTQRGRIEAARRGVLLHADFIDNSAGVDCSDHEVNLKILLGLAETAGELDRPGRDELLAQVTDDIVAHVLYNSYLQAQILAQEVRVSAVRMFAYEDLMASLEADGMLDRDVEGLPRGDDMAERRRAGRGLERPELAVLLAYAKRSLTEALLRSPFVDDPALDADVRAYFPAAVTERFGAHVAAHPLRRELVATLVANDVVNALGPTFVSSLVAEQGADPAAIVRAYRVARDVTGAKQRWDAIEALGPAVDVEVTFELMADVDDLVAGVARWYLAAGRGDQLGDVAAARDAFARLEAAMHDLRSEQWRADCDAVAQRLRDRGVTDAMARRHALQKALLHAPDIVAVAEQAGADVEQVGRAFFVLGEALGLEWLEVQILALPAGTRLQRWAVNAILDDVLAARRELVARALAEHGEVAADAAVDAFLDSRFEARNRFEAFTRALVLEGSTDLAGITLAVRQLRALAM